LELSDKLIAKIELDIVCYAVETLELWVEHLGAFFTAIDGVSQNPLYNLKNGMHHVLRITILPHQKTIHPCNLVPKPLNVVISYLKVWKSGCEIESCVQLVKGEVVLFTPQLERNGAGIVIVEGWVRVW